MIYKQQKRLGWIAFDYDLGNTPPTTSDGKQYLCINYMGNMQVCIWDGRAREWIYSINEMVNFELQNASCNAAAMAALELVNKRLPKSKQLSEIEQEEFLELCVEKAASEKCNFGYFDGVEWYMELPDTPKEVGINAKHGDTVQAEIFEQELDLMSHIEQAIKNYSREKAKIIKPKDSDAP